MENSAKQSAKDKEESLDELKTAITTQFEAKKRSLYTLHAREIEEL